MNKVRVDKWLWGIRIFKTRTLATDNCKTGKVKVNGVVAKPSQSISVNDLLEVKKDGFNLQFKVLQLLEKRVGAEIARTCYENLTPIEELNKYQSWFVGKGGVEVREKGAGRPTKADRRQIDTFKVDWFFLDEDDEEED
jgi:ribosome-associated heat shock protein Hsp15